MPYTRAWDETQPPGTALAASLDTIIQNFKTDTRERVAGIFGLNLAEFTADPIVPKSLSLSVGYTGNMTGNVTGNVTGNLTGTVLTAAQPNITSLGTLTSLAVTGTSQFLTNQLTIELATNGTDVRFQSYASKILNINQLGNQVVIGGATTINSTLGVTGAITGTLATAAQPNITSLGTLTNLALSGSVTLGNGFYYKATRQTGAAVISVLGFDDGTTVGNAGDWLMLRTGGFGFKIRDTGGTNQLVIDSAGNTVFSGTVTAANFVGPTSIDANALTGTTLAAGVIHSSLIDFGVMTGPTAKFLIIDNVTAGLSRIDFKVGGTRYGGIGSSAWALGDGLTDVALFADAGKRIKFIPNATSSAQVVIETTGVITAQGFTGNITGTILTAAQGNITSVGTLVNLSVTGAITSNASVNVNSVSGIIDIYATSGGHFNWRIRKSDTVANWLQFTPSTAADGLTFTSPTFHLVQTGQVLIGTTSLTGVAAGGLHVAGGSVFDSSLSVGASLLINGGETKYISGVSGTNGTGIFSRWYRDDGTTVKGGLGYFSNDSIVFTVGSRIASGTTVLTTGAATVAITLNSDASVTYVGAVNGITTLTATTLVGNLTGTINTSAQANITSLGTLTSLTVSGLSTFGTGHILQGASTSVGAVTTIYTVPSNSGGIVLVYGSDGTNIFIDEVLVGDTAASVALAHQFTIAGAPATRTYSMSSGLLRLAMGSGTYTIKTMPFYVN